jgi:hypothetical protein
VDVQQVLKGLGDVGQVLEGALLPGVGNEALAALGGMVGGRG